VGLNGMKFDWDANALKRMHSKGENMGKRGKMGRKGSRPTAADDKFRIFD